MSAFLFVQYGPCYVQFAPEVKLVDEQKDATQFTSESDAWLAVNAAHLNPDRCEVVGQKEGV